MKRAQRLFNPAYGQINAPAHMVAALLSLGELDAAERWLDWMAARQSANETIIELRTQLYVAHGDPDALARYFDALQQTLAPSQSFLIDTPKLALLRARLAQPEDRPALREQARMAQRTRSEAYVAAGSPGRLLPPRQYIAAAVASGPHEPGTDVLAGIRKYYEDGGFLWSVDHIHMHLALCHALNGDVAAAMAEFRTAVDYGFNELFRLEALNVLDDPEGVFRGLGEDPEFLNLVRQIELSNADVRDRIRESALWVLDPEQTMMQ